MSITGIVITLNEQNNIRDCIENMQTVCDEIIVVDSNSSDQTREIAAKLGAKVIVQEYLGDGFQKNFALNDASSDWILSLDADERFPEALNNPEMIAEIKSLDLKSTKYDAFGFPRRNYIGSRWIKHSGWYPDVCVRLYNRTKARFKEVKQHSYVETKNYKILHGDIIHYSFKNLGELFAKPGRNFSTRSAKIMYEKGKKANSFSPVLHGINSFIRHYVFGLGFLDGIDGFTVSLSSAVNGYLKYAKLLEYYRDPKVLNSENFNKIW